MPKIVRVKKAQQRYKMVPVIEESTGMQKRTPVLGKDGKQKTDKRGNPTFRKVTKEDKSQPLDPEKCGKCGKEIAVGDPYKHTTVKRTYGGVRMVRCVDCPDWRQWELTTSKMAPIMQAQDQTSFDDCEDYQSIVDTLEEFANTVRDVAAEYEESADNIEDGFGHETYQSAELREKYEALEAWADELEQLDEQEPEKCEDHVDSETDDDDDDPECEACDELKQEALDNMRADAEEKIMETPV
jgi:hypothetical protein